MTLLTVIEKFPELKIKTIELVANLARKGMYVPMGPNLKNSRFLVSLFRFPIALLRKSADFLYEIYTDPLV